MGALATIQRQSKALVQEINFDLRDLRIFDTIPAYHHGIVALRGNVVVYETDALHRENVQEGGLYVIERQHPPSLMPYHNWLSQELEDLGTRSRGGPWSKLTTTREVVQAQRLGGANGEKLWFYRLQSGFHDGPIADWAVAFGLVGKVVGIYHPT